LTHITKDKKSTAYQFKKGTQNKITLLKENPFMCRISYYFEEKAYKRYGISGIYDYLEGRTRTYDYFRNF